MSAITAQASAVAIAPSLSPDRPGAHASLAFAVRFSGGELGVPPPVRNALVRMPSGLMLQVPHLRSCTAATLLASGPSGCPRQSLLGGGSALLATRIGDETVTERATLSIVLGPPANLRPTFEVLARGYTPVFGERVLSGEVLSAQPPYGEELRMSVAPISTLSQAPDASLLSLSLRIGDVGARSRSQTNSVVIPAHCPAGGFPFAAQFTYQSGMTQSVRTRVRCPR